MSKEKAKQDWPIDIGVKPYYQDDYCVIYNADCREILPLLPKVDLLLTDPPYRQSKSGGGLVEKRAKFKELTQSNLNEFDPSDVLPMILHSTKSMHGYFFCSKNLLKDYIEIFDQYGLNWNVLCMHKRNPIPCKKNTYLTDIEFIMFCRGKGCYFNDSLEYELYSKVKSINVSPSGFDHPTVKPISIILGLIRVSSAIGHVILDPMCGTATSLRAAKDLQRKAIGIEIEEKYCEIGAKRLRQEVLPL